MGGLDTCKQIETMTETEENILIEREETQTLTQTQSDGLVQKRNMDNYAKE